MPAYRFACKLLLPRDLDFQRGRDKLTTISQPLPIWLQHRTTCPEAREKCDNPQRRFHTWAAARARLAQPMPSTHKKVIVRKMDRDSINGYVAPANFVVDGRLEMLNTAGNLVGIELRDIKVVYFVREFSE